MNREEYTKFDENTNTTTTTYLENDTFIAKCVKTPKEEKWYNSKDRLHREDGPAHVHYYANNTKYEYYCIDGNLHREDGPALIYHHVNGAKDEYYYINGKLHREDGPALIHHHDDGTKNEHYYINGKLHREDGPAYIHHHDDGTKNEFWYKNGEEIPAPQPAAKPINEAKAKITAETKVKLAELEAMN